MRACCLLIAAVLTAAGGAAPAQDRDVHLRMNSLLHPKHFGEAGARFAETVAMLSEGSLDIEFHDRMVLDQDAFAAMEAGVIDAVWGSAGHHHREDAALTLFSGFPFGPDPETFVAWMTRGGGAEALDAIYARHGLKSVFCGVLPAEGGGWFRAPVEGLGDLDGLNMRVFGYGGEVMRRLGVTPYELGAAEIRPALETSVIDGAEFSVPSIDAELGLTGVAGHLYFPGWQQPATSLEILLPLETWERLSERHRAIINVACGDTIAWSLAEVGLAQVTALDGFRDAGVTFHIWPDDIQAALRAAWEDVIAEEAAADPLLADAWEGYEKFSAGWGDWRRIAYPD